MNANDFNEFSEMLCDVYCLYEKKITDRQLVLFFQALEDQPIAAVKAAFIAHIKDPVRGRYPPLPADIIGRIMGESGYDWSKGAI